MQAGLYGVGRCFTQMNLSLRNGSRLKGGDHEKSEVSALKAAMKQITIFQAQAGERAAHQAMAICLVTTRRAEAKLTDANNEIAASHWLLEALLATTTILFFSLLSGAQGKGQGDNGPFDEAKRAGILDKTDISNSLLEIVSSLPVLRPLLPCRWKLPERHRGVQRHRHQGLIRSDRLREHDLGDGARVRDARRNH